MPAGRSPRTATGGTSARRCATATGTAGWWSRCPAGVAARTATASAATTSGAATPSSTTRAEPTRTDRDGLVLFLDDGWLELDTNTIEREIRPISLGRKNALFAGSDGGACHWAVVASLVAAAKLNGVEPLAW